VKAKAIRDLLQLSDPDFLSEVSVGLRHILNSAIRLERDAELLAENGRIRGHRILLGMAEEEAAKFLILLDAVRCPRVPSNKQISRHLGGFYDHVAKGIYAEACYLRPATFGELANWIENSRQKFFLDGPNDVDWIFRNRILQEREEAIYVDYVATDEDHLWIRPSEDGFGFAYIGPPPVVRLAQALSDSGCTSPEALASIAEFWRPVKMTEDYHWATLRDLNYETLEELDDQNLLREQPQEVYSTIVNKWPFPLYSLELKLASVDQAVLREKQRQWVPDWWMPDW